jgi:hypothetical protein
MLRCVKLHHVVLKLEMMKLAIMMMMMMMMMIVSYSGAQKARSDAQCAGFGCVAMPW